MERDIVCEGPMTAINRAMLRAPVVVFMGAERVVGHGGVRGERVCGSS